MISLFASRRVALTPLIAAASLILVVHAQAGPQVVKLRLASRLFQNTRTIRVLLPDGYSEKSHSRTRYPVLYLNDGYEVFASWNIQTTVQRLIGDGSINPLIVVGIDHADEQEGDTTQENLTARANEYLPFPVPAEPGAPNPRGVLYPTFLASEVMPLIQKRFRTKSGPENIGIGGASFGALIALYTVIERPNLAGKLLLESGGVPPATSPLRTRLEFAKKLPLVISLGIGTNEDPDPEVNRQFVVDGRAVEALIRDVSPRSRIRFIVEQGAKHDGTAWAGRLPGALTFLFGRT